MTLFHSKSSFLEEQGLNAQRYGVCFSPDKKTWGVDLFSSLLFLDWKPLENVNKQPTCFSCKTSETNLIKGGSTEKLGVAHDVHLQVLGGIFEYDSLHPSLYPCLQTWDVAVSMRLTCSYIQKKKFHICSALQEKQNIVITSAIKTGSGGNFIWLRKWCSCGPLDFAASCLILFKTCEANIASLLLKKWLALLLQVARGGEVQGTPSSWHSFKTGGVRGSAMLGNTTGNMWWLLALWRMENGASAGRSQGATKRTCRDVAMLYPKPS